MIGLFDTFKKWTGATAANQSEITSQLENLLQFAKVHHLDNKVMNIGSVLNVKKVNPTFNIEKFGKNISNIMFHDKGYGMNLYVGRVDAAQDIYSGRVFDNVLEDNGLSICNISQLRLSDQEKILGFASDKLACYHMINEGKIAHHWALHAVADFMTSSEATSFTEDQAEKIETFLVDYIPIGQHKFAAGALTDAAKEMTTSINHPEKYNMLNKELDAVLSGIEVKFKLLHQNYLSLTQGSTAEELRELIKKNGGGFEFDRPIMDNSSGKGRLKGKECAIFSISLIPGSDKIQFVGWNGEKDNGAPYPLDYPNLSPEGQKRLIEAVSDRFQSKMLAKQAIHDRIVTPSARSFTPDQVNNLNRYHEVVSPNTPAGEVFRNLLQEVAQDPDVARKPEKWITDTGKELDELADGITRDQSRGMRM